MRRGGRHRGGGHFGQAMARQRLALVSVSFLFVALGVGLAVFAFRDALTFFLTPLGIDGFSCRRRPAVPPRRARSVRGDAP